MAPQNKAYDPAFHPHQKEILKGQRQSFILKPKHQHPSKDAHKVHLYNSDAPFSVERTRSICTRSCKLYRLFVGTALLSTITVCLFVWATSSVIEKRVLAKLSAMNHHQHQHHLQDFMSQEVYAMPQAQALESDEDEVTVQRRQNQHRQRRRNNGRRRRRRTGCVNQVKEAIHLQVASGNYVQGRENNRMYFLWSEVPARSLFILTRAQNHEPPGDVWGVKIPRAGVYDVYSQVVISGRSSSRLPYQCAHETVLLRGSRIHKILLKSFITQMELGLEITNLNPTEEEWLPVDSVYHRGVFFLEANDELRVSVSPRCEHIRFSNAEPHAMFFGVAQR